MWGCARWWWQGEIRRLSSAVLRQLEDEGDWFYSPEWWGGGGVQGHTVFNSISQHGNGIVSVIAYPSSRPAAEQWPPIERWLQKRHTAIHPELRHNEQFKILGYQWRVLRFNDETKQSTVKIMAAYAAADPASLYLMQQPHCLAVPYLKSMVSAGLTALSSSDFDLPAAVRGEATMKILCIGHGGGSLPLFLAKKIKGASIHIVEIDPVVISASVEAMGFPSAAIEKSDVSSIMQPSDAYSLLWGDIHNQLCVYRSDAENFVVDVCNMYDLVFIDAYDGDDIFPRKLWDPHCLFLESLQTRLHPVHGTAVVNLHADSDALAGGFPGLYFHDSVLPMGKHVMQVCRAYKEHLGFAYVVPVPWLCNLTLVASTGVGFGRGKTLAFLDADMVLSALLSKASMVDQQLDLSFSCLEYAGRGFMLID